MKSSHTAAAEMPLIYEKVSIQDAQNAVRDHRPAYHKNWSRERLPGAAEILMGASMVWLAALPEAVRPVELTKRYPRIVNTLARLWPRPAEWQHAVAELLIVRRGDTIRQGFPPSIARELVALNSYQAAQHPAPALELMWN